MKVDPRAVPSDTLLSPLDGAGAQRVERSRAALFDALLPTPVGDLARRSLRRDVERLGESGSIGPSLFAGSRPGEILEDILDRILPSLELDEDTKNLAMTLVRDELDTRRSLDQQRADSGE